MKGGARPSPFAALSFPNWKKIPIYCWVDRVFQLIYANDTYKPGRLYVLMILTDLAGQIC